MDNTSNNSTKRRFLLGIGLLATGVLSYFGFEYWKNHKQKSKTTYKKAPDFKAEKPKSSPTKTAKPNANSKTTASHKTTQTKASSENVSDFPIKKGSKGDRVKTLQQALINKHGKSILHKGADGIYGNDLQAALQKLKLPEIIDETTYNVITQKKQFNAPLVSRALYAAIKAKSFNAALILLKTIKSSENYTAVNKLFSNYFIGGVRQTLVNAMLNSFIADEQKQAIRLAFAGMGLKYDGKKWSLSGLEDKPLLITTQATKVWKDPNNSVPVPINMVLGKEIDRKKDFSLFENDNQYFLVESNHVNYYKQ